MIDEKKYKKAVAEFLKNPSWKAEYDAAPTELSRRYKGLEFYYSDNALEMDTNDEMWGELKKEMDELEAKMGLEDWEYLYKHCGNNPFKSKCKKKIEVLKAKSE